MSRPIPLTLRLRHPAGVTTLTVPDTSAPISTLLAQITSLTSLSEPLDLKRGYPPKTLLYRSPDEPIATLGLEKGEQLVVASGAASSTSTPAIAPAAPPVSSTPFETAPSLRTETGGLFGGNSSTTTIANPSMTRKDDDESGDSVPLSDGGHLALFVVPDDNSCLFTSVSVAFEGSMDAAGKLRRVVADAIRADPETYSEVFLERSPEAYIKTILEPKSWGGAIELSIFAKYYQTEISSLDVATNRIDHFGSSSGYTQRALLVYSGIHYDPLVYNPLGSERLTSETLPFCETRFNVGDQRILDAAMEMGRKLKRRRYYTDTAKFDLRCARCGAGLVGEKQAREHAKETGHVEFGEY